MGFQPTGLGTYDEPIDLLLNNWGEDQYKSVMDVRKRRSADKVTVADFAALNTTYSTVAKHCDHR